jgi:multiple sugar transport system substrate-binding protein
MLRGKITEECQKALGIKLNVETIEGNGIQPRITSAIQSATGPDIIMAINNWPQLYGDSVADVSDVAEEIGKAGDGYYETAKTVANDGNKWIAVPFTILGVLLTNRKSWWAEIGYNAENFPATWEEYVAAGKKLKPKGQPLGQTLGHTFGDAPAFWYPYLWSWGGKERWRRRSRRAPPDAPSFTVAAGPRVPIPCGRAHDAAGCISKMFRYAAAEP